MAQIYLNSPTNISDMKGVCTVFIKNPGGDHPTRINNYSWPGDRLSYINFRWQESLQWSNGKELLINDNSYNYTPTIADGDGRSGSNFSNMTPFDYSNVQQNRRYQFKNYINQVYYANENESYTGAQRVWDIREKKYLYYDDDYTEAMMVRVSQLVDPNTKYTPIGFLGLQIQFNLKADWWDDSMSDRMMYRIARDNQDHAFRIESYAGPNGKTNITSTAIEQDTVIKLINISDYKEYPVSKFTLPKGEKLEGLRINITPIMEKSNIMKDANGNYFYDRMYIDFAVTTDKHANVVTRTESGIYQTMYRLFANFAFNADPTLVPVNNAKIWFFSIAKK